MRFEHKNPFANLGEECNEVGNDAESIAGVTGVRTSKPIGLLEKGCADLCQMAASEWQPLPKPLVVDSGAGETVIPTDWLPKHEIEESVGSRSREYYTTADGTKIYNEGQKCVAVSCMDGTQERSMTFQVAQVDKALGSVSQMVRNNKRLVFDADEAGKDISYIQNKITMEKMPLRVENGVYVIDLMVGPPGYQIKPQWHKSTNWDFAWQG